MSKLTSMKVHRVLVMVEYEAGKPADVFDLTALALEIAPKGEHRHASIELDVTTGKDYSAPSDGCGNWPLNTKVSWRVMANFNSSPEAGMLDDAINSALPDSFATQDMKKKSKKIRAKLEKIEEDILMQRLMDAAAIRHKHPIARVTEAPALAEVAGQTGEVKS